MIDALRHHARDWSLAIAVEELERTELYGEKLHIFRKAFLFYNIACFILPPYSHRCFLCWMDRGFMLDFEWGKAQAVIRRKYVQVLLNQDMSFFDTYGNNGDIVSQVLSDVLLIQSGQSEKEHATAYKVTQKFTHEYSLS
ncbi:hypothetical protein QYE76_051718 [Lolium multiflorum]|uniref:ABC transmembrane type-1 domain-containing protein n=1 Tax=Lolium multiflorum TaxID=4521 RepID=A0AAD8STA7_LOLMU|nr:hypothetical protein QYE76_051718 [Lolium multiflorum]